MDPIPEVSVIIPTLNEERYLPILLASLREINAPIEIVIVDGGSTDKTKLVVEEFRRYFTGDTMIKFISSDKKSISVQRNLGVKHAKNDIILFCDADIVAPTTNEHRHMISEFLKHEYVIAAGRITPLENGLVVNVVHNLAHVTQRTLSFLGKPYFGGAYLLTKKDVFLEVGGFDENLRVSEDVDFSIRTSAKGPHKLFNIPIKVSTRRFQKYGYSWIYKNPSLLMKLLLKGKLTEKDDAFYPFGEY